MGVDRERASEGEEKKTRSLTNRLVKERTHFFFRSQSRSLARCLSASKPPFTAERNPSNPRARLAKTAGAEREKRQRRFAGSSLAAASFFFVLFLPPPEMQHPPSGAGPPPAGASAGPPVGASAAAGGRRTLTAEQALEQKVGLRESRRGSHRRRLFFFLSLPSGIEEISLPRATALASLFLLAHGPRESVICALVELKRRRNQSSLFALRMLFF